MVIQAFDNDIPTPNLQIPALAAPAFLPGPSASRPVPSAPAASRPSGTHPASVPPPASRVIARSTAPVPPLLQLLPALLDLPSQLPHPHLLL